MSYVGGNRRYNITSHRCFDNRCGRSDEKKKEKKKMREVFIPKGKTNIRFKDLRHYLYYYGSSNFLSAILNYLSNRPRIEFITMCSTSIIGRSDLCFTLQSSPKSALGGLWYCCKCKEANDPWFADNSCLKCQHCRCHRCDGWWRDWTICERDLGVIEGGERVVGREAITEYWAAHCCWSQRVPVHACDWGFELEFESQGFE